MYREVRSVLMSVHKLDHMKEYCLAMLLVMMIVIQLVKHLANLKEDSYKILYRQMDKRI
jgi:hypothetical protein